MSTQARPPRASDAGRLGGVLSTITSSADARDRPDHVVRTMLLVASLATLAFAGKLLALCDRGFDFTDEGFYLNMILRPGSLPVSVTQFGFVYHSLFEALGRQIALLRQANLAICFILSVAATLALLSRLARDKAGAPSIWSASAIGIAIVTAASSLLTLSFINAMWLPTPSYNSLAFQALVVTSIGFCLADQNASRLSISGWLLIGVGGFLAAMGKPTTAALLGGLVFVGLCIDGRLLWRRLAVSAAVSSVLLLAAAWSIGGSISSFVRQLQAAAANAASMSNSHSADGIIRLDRFDLDPTGWAVFAAIAAFLLMTIKAFGSRSQARRKIAGAAILGITVVAALIIADVIDVGSSPNRSYGAIMFALPAGAAAGMLLLSKLRRVALSRRRLSLMFFSVFYRLPLHSDRPPIIG